MVGDQDKDVGVKALATRDAGTDEAVYEDVDIEELPQWWQKAIAEHKEFGLRPYRPPQFLDGTITPPIIEHLETQYDVTIQLRGKNVSPGDKWTVFVDQSPAFTVPRRRDPDGYTVLEISRKDFVNSLKSFLED